MKQQPDTLLCSFKDRVLVSSCPSVRPSRSYGPLTYLPTQHSAPTQNVVDSLVFLYRSVLQTFTARNLYCFHSPWRTYKPQRKRSNQ